MIGFFALALFMVLCLLVLYCITMHQIENKRRYIRDYIIRYRAFTDLIYESNTICPDLVWEDREVAAFDKNLMRRVEWENKYFEVS